MIRPGDRLLRRRKTRSISESRARWLLIFCLLTAFNPFARADMSAGSSADAFADLSPGNFSSSNSPAADTNFSPSAVSGEQTGTNNFNASLAMARYFENARQPEKAEPILVGLLAENVPDSIQKSALLELGATVRGENDLPRAQTIYAQFLNRWPNDVKVPEILLRQGEIFRQMGLNDMALGKFYSVMTSALALKNDQLAYYQSLVLQTQIEIAETHYLMGRFADAADFYSRLLQKTDPALNRPQMQFRLIRSLAIIGRNDEAVGQAQDFLSRYADADEAPEVRYYLAESLKALGRNNEALQQVLLCLQEQKIKTKNDPEVWAYWQQRVGNEIANQLYHEGDYIKALEVYINLAQLDSTPAWQVPVDYQMGMTYEKLLQPQKAIDTYNQILARETEVGTNSTPGLKAVFDMARWRVGFIQWQTNAEAVDHSLAESALVAVGSGTNTQTSIKQ
ncbi:MAG TPA: tetratricopeptide repeat protein [Verrucomicrobiae bacterium]|jgi:tetratricopeptide (TPR) repeat protein